MVQLASQLANDFDNFSCSVACEQGPCPPQPQAESSSLHGTATCHQRRAQTYYPKATRRKIK